MLQPLYGAYGLPSRRPVSPLLQYLRDPITVNSSPKKRKKKSKKDKRRARRKAQKRFLKKVKSGALPIDITLDHQYKQQQVAGIIHNKLLLQHYLDGGVHFGRDPFGNPSYYVGKHQDDDGNILAIGSPGSHKTSALILPTILGWQGMFVATDIKGDISAMCRRHRRRMRRLTKFIDFVDLRGDSWHYDPYLKLHQGGEDDLVSNASELALALNPTRSEAHDPFWQEAEHSILTGIILYAFGGGYTFNETIETVLDTHHRELLEAIIGSDNIHAKRHIAQYIGRGSQYLDDKTLKGVFMGIANRLMVFANPQIKRVFSASDNVIDWAEDTSSCNVVISIPESKIEQWGGAVRLMLAQLLTTLTNRPDKYSFEGRNQDPVLLIFDEAARWGKLEVLPEALTTLRSRCVTTLMAIQSIASLDRTYGTPTRRVILDCCSYTVIAAVHDAETQKYCSELVGGYHTWSPSMSETYHPSRWEIDVSRQLSAHREPILYPEEFATLREFVLVSPYGTYFVEKDPYYETEPLLFEQRQDGFRRLLPANKYEEDYFYDDPRTHR